MSIEKNQNPKPQAGEVCAVSILPITIPFRSFVRGASFHAGVVSSARLLIESKSQYDA